MSTPWYQRPFVIYDIETGGVKRDVDRIVTATVGYLKPGHEPVIHEWVINPGVEIAQEAIDVHGYTNERLAEEGQEPAAAIAAITDTLEFYLGMNTVEATPLVIYNAPFDISMSDREQRRYGIVPLVERIALSVICPMTIDKALNPFVKGKGMRRLTPTAARYGIELKAAHNATADATATGELARQLVIDQPGDNWKIKDRRAALREASLEKLQGWQCRWYREQKESLANYFAGQKNVEAAESCRAEAPFFPYVPVGQLVD